MPATLTPPVIVQPLAIEAAQDCELSSEAQALLAPQVKAASFLAQLAREGLWMDALRLAPHALGRSESIWWAALCLWQFYRPAPPPEADACLAAVTSWLQDRSEANRRAAYDAGKRAKTTTPAGNLALAVFFESGSMSLPDRPNVPVKPHYLPRTLSSAVTLAIKQSPPDERVARQSDYVRLALEVMAGRWPLPASSQESR
jgi:hypothetical protein